MQGGIGGIHIISHCGLVGSTLVCHLTNPFSSDDRGHPNSSPASGGGGEREPPIYICTHTEFGLTDQSAIDAFRARGKHGSMRY